MKQLWLAAMAARCCRDPRPLEPKEPSWIILGLFEDKADAVALCEDCRYFVVPVPIGVKLPEDEKPPAEWPVKRHFVPAEAKPEVVV